MVATIKFTAAESGVVHDGTSMIVMNKGKVTEAPAGAEDLLREKGFIKGSARAGQKAEEVGSPELTAALARAEAAEARVAELEAQLGKGGSSRQPAKSDDQFDVPDGYAVIEKGGGWYEVTGPEGFEPVKAHGAEDLRETLALIAAGDDAAPAS